MGNHMSTISASTTTTTAYVVTADTTGALVLQTGATPTTAITVDTSQNVGIGVTPSAFGSGFKGLQMNGGALMAYNGTNMYYLNNAYYDGTNYKYVNTGYATNYVQSSGQHTWSYAASGTGGNTATFTEAMRIDSSGNLGLGVTPSAWGSTWKMYQTGRAAFGSVGGNLTVISQNFYSDTGGIDKYIANDYSTMYYQSSGQHIWRYAASGTAGNAITFTQAMTLDASGNLLVGTTTTIGTSSAGNTHIAGGNSQQLYLRHTGATAGKFWRVGPDSSSNTFTIYNQSNGAGVYLTDGGSSWTGVSDERLKTTLIPFVNAVEKVCSLRAGTGRYLTDEESVSRSFLIAQDVQTVLPEAVNVRDDEIGTLGLQYTDLIPLLVASIKELKQINDTQAETINALQADVTELKTKVGA
jgi:hypothetical protein